MKSSTRLDSALFQLTPTRTRCDLVISANGKTEKLASGLLNPFLAHLKTAQEQMAKGGYSIILEPESDVSWFTKGTLERFVRFVSTPEVLERVYSLESEILQIEEAIAIQGNSETALSTVEDSPEKPTEAFEASRPSPDASDEKAIVLYKPGENPPEANGSTGKGGNSKVQLLKVLETRKTVLQKEQGMAFARAVAAGFEIDNISPLMSFSEAFGASRLRDACKRFKELWKKKHETGQWVEIEATEAMSNRADFTAMAASGIILSSVANAELSSESNGKSDEKPSSEHQAPQGHPEYFQGQFPHQMYPPWPIQSPPGTVPMFQPYPVPYYQNYPGPAQFYQQPYPPAADDPRFNAGPRAGQRRHSMEGINGNNTESETLEADEEEFEQDSSRKRSNRSGKKKPGVVVIRNLNYIASKGDRDRSDDEDGSRSGSESEPREPSKKTAEDADSAAPAGGHWEAFQNFLLREPEEEEKRSSDVFSSENKARSKGRQSKTGEDPILFGGRDNGESRNGVSDTKNMNGNNSRVLRRGSADEPMGSRRDGSSGDVDGQSLVFSSEVNGRRVYRNSTNEDDFAVDRHSSGFTGSSSDINGFERSKNNVDRRSSNNMDNDSYIVSSRGRGGAENRRSIVDMGSELANQKEDHRGPVSYEPEELSMMPRRGAESGSAGYDPALDYEIEGVSGNKKKNKESAVVSEEATKRGSKKLLEKGPRSRVVQDDRKKNVGPIRRGKPSKLSPLEEARARAEKLRTFKADLQKMKKEKEAAEMKRLEALKMERQKRIAARGGGGSGSGPTLPSPPTKKQVPVRSSSTSLRASKFSDSEPGSTSPLQRYHTRTGSIGSNDSQKPSKSTSRLSRSAASLPAPKRETTAGGGGGGSASARIRRLSEPRISNHPISSLRAKSKIPDSSEVKKLSAIVNYDKGKAATLPGLKIKTPSPPVPPKGSSVNSEAKKKKNEKLSSSIDADENPIVEKTVLVLEREKPSVPGVDYDSVPAPVSKVAADAVGGDRVITNPVITSDTKKEISTVSSIDTAEKPYQAPYARASSFEDVCTENSDYGKALPTSLEPTGSASFKAQVFDSRGLKLEKIPEVSEKIQTKESSSSKGFRRLLKFGRKSNGSGGERNPESDNVSFNGSDTDDNGMSTEVHTLKNLISQDETPTAEAAPQKSSRHFSLLSPFRSSKSSEKK